MTTSVVLLTRDLRVHDHPALAAAAATSEHVQPLFVFDPEALRHASPTRAAFLLESLVDLRRQLAERGANLAVRRGDAVAETVRLAREVAASSVHVSEDVSSHAHRRERRLHSDLATARVPFFPHPGVTVVPPGDLAPPGADHYRVFTPYWRRWSVHPRRIPLAAPRRLASPAGVDGGQLPELAELVPGRPAPESPGGGETAGRRRLHGWLRDDGARYEARRDVPADDCTTRLGAYIHLGCVSPLAVATAAQDAGAVDLVRQLAWRDFFHQVLAADPRRARGDMYDGRRTWIDDPTGVDAWRDGQTGYPFVDAGMRQLRREGFMHNRARLVTASFLTRSLSVDWRVGADHFAALLADADVASNAGNWQWVAGTGANSRPNRVLSPIRQAHRFDPNGDYVRRYVPELAAIPDGRIHEPWALGVRRPPAYPDRVAVGDEARRPAPRRRGRLVRRRCGTPGTPPRSRG